jgi:hypothetical protein
MITFYKYVGGQKKPLKGYIHQNGFSLNYNHCRLCVRVFHIF